MKDITMILLTLASITFTFAIQSQRETQYKQLAALSIEETLPIKMNNTSLIPYVNICMKDGSKLADYLQDNFYMAAISSFFILVFTINKWMILSRKIKLNQVSYIFVTVCFYWQIMISSLLLRLLQNGNIILKIQGRIIFVSTLAICLAYYLRLKLNRTLPLQVKCSIAIHGIQLCLLLFKISMFYISMFYRITIFAALFSPIMQMCFYLAKIQNEQFIIFTVPCCASNITLFSAMMIGKFPEILMDPFLVQHFRVISPCFFIYIIFMCHKYIFSLGTKTLKYIHKKLKKVRPNDSCVICLNQMDSYVSVYQVYLIEDIVRQRDRQLFQLPCKHIYHSKCLYRWIKQKFSCPLDSQEIPYQSE